MGLFGLFGGSSSKPEDLADVYMDAKSSGDNETMQEVEDQMYQEHGYTFHHGMWQDDEKPASGGLLGWLFG